MPEPKHELKSPILRISQKDLSRMLETGEAKIIPQTKEFPLLSLKSAVDEFRSVEHTPDVYTQVFQSIWKVRGGILLTAALADVKEADFIIPPCPYSKEEIEHLEKEGRRLGYLPKRLSHQRDRYLLALLFPEMKAWGTEKDPKKNTIKNEEDRSGWFDYESSISAPNTDLTERGAQELAKEKGRFGMNLNEYIIASRDSKLLYDNYLDQFSQPTQSARLLGSQNMVNSRVISVSTYVDGKLYVSSHIDPSFQYGGTGWRFVGVKK